MPLDLTWQIALVLIADGFLIGTGWTIAALIVGWLNGRLHR